MTENNTNTPDTEAVATAEAAAPAAAPKSSTDAGTPRTPRAGFRAGAPRGARAPFKKRTPGGRPGSREGGRRAPQERVKPEFDQKILDIRRVTRVVSGGRRFSFSVAIALGDRNGRVGLGTGKSSDTSLAIEKAVKDARKKMITLKLTKSHSIAHDVSAKFASSKVFIMPNRGRGLIAGSSARVLLALAGMKDVTAKFHSGSKNKLNNGKVTMKALESIAYKHGEMRVVPKTEMVEEATNTPTE